jgi:hypothetical protein
VKGNRNQLSCGEIVCDEEGEMPGVWLIEEMRLIENGGAKVAKAEEKCENSASQS